MNKIEQSHLGSMTRVVGVFKKYVHITDASVMLSTCKAKMEAGILEINTLDTEELAIPKKTGTLKKEIRDAIETVLLPVGTGLSFWAQEQNNLDLANVLHTSVSSISRLRNDTLAKYAAIVLVNAESNKEALLAFDVTEAMITTLQTLLPQFQEEEELPKAKSNEHKAKDIKKKQKIRDLWSYLNDVVSKQMYLHKSEEDFYADYVIAKKLVDPLTIKKKKKTKEKVSE